MTCDVSTLNNSLIIMPVIIKKQQQQHAAKVLLCPSAISQHFTYYKNPFCHHCCFSNYDNSEVKRKNTRERKINENAKVIKSFTYYSQTTNEV